MSLISSLRWCTSTLSIAFASIAMITAASASSKGKENILHNFSGRSDGAAPAAQLMADSAGDFFGTTRVGGDGRDCDTGIHGCGTVFEITSSGAEKVLHSFASGCDGSFPEGGVVSDSQNNLYGTTTGGGLCNSRGGHGTVFEITPDGVETVLYAFHHSSDGGVPLGNLAIDKNGNLFGTAAQGGDMTLCGGNGCGVVFEVTPAGVETVLHTFEGGADGLIPGSGLMMNGSGNLFGTTSNGGGAANCTGGCGTVFEIAPNGAETVLYAFQGGRDGCLPMAGVISDSSQNLYGTAEACGANYGVVFKVAPDGSETTLHSFQSGSDGELPAAGLVMDKSGALYGTTPYGGGTGCKKIPSCGTIFKVTATGREKVLYAFQQNRGIVPEAGLLLGRGDALYGTAAGGGRHNRGVVFELKK